MPTTIRTNDPRELLALIPFQLGFQPDESLVAVSVRADRAVGLIARVDVADLAPPEPGGQLARSLVAHLSSDGAQRVVVVVYTAQDLQDGLGSTPAAAVEQLRASAEHVLGDVDCWVVGPAGYYSLGCRDRECCPAGGRSLDGLQSTRVGAQMVLEGVQVARSRDGLVRIPQASASARKAARRSRVRWEARFPASAGPAQAHQWRLRGLEVWRCQVADVGVAASGPWDAADAAGVAPLRFGSTSPVLPPPTAVGKLLAALDDVLVRDAVLLAFVPGAERVADRIVAGDTAADVGNALEAIIDPVRGTRPDPERTGPARLVLEHLVAHAPRRGHAPTLTLLAVLAWWEGDGARAGVLVDRALAADPDYRLARLVDDALRLGMPPGWVRAGR